MQWNYCWIAASVGLALWANVAAQELLIQDPEAMRIALVEILPTRLSIVQKLGNGQGELYVMVDPLDPNSKKLVRNIQGLNHATVYYYLAPLDAPNSEQAAKNIWCTRDRLQALLAVMVHERVLNTAPASCSPAGVSKLRHLVDTRVARPRPLLLSSQGLGAGVATTEDLASVLFQAPLSPSFKAPGAACAMPCLAP
jgi:hypothetical protein